MINNFIGGGQVFLHKVRMFWQVFTRTIHIALLIGIIIGSAFHSDELKELDWSAFYSYRKAVLADEFDEAINKIRISIGKKPNHISFVNAKTKAGVWGVRIDPRKVIRSYVFKRANNQGIALGQSILIWSGTITFFIFITIVLIWSRFGKDLKADKIKDGENKVLTAKEVRKKLHSLGKASDLKIGEMPLVKDMETRHFLVTGSTGSGKTNLIHNLLPQIENKEHPAIIIDQTGEMIARYYNPQRGDIIFNPFDERGLAWDFWQDCGSREDLERFSKILIGFNRKQSGSRSDPFWENAAESVFNACIEFLKPRKASIRDIVDMVCYADIIYLQTVLVNTEAARYLGEDSKPTVSSIASVLAANAKPLCYLPEITDGSSFSMKGYFEDIKNGSKAWLFLSTKPSARSLTMPLIACMTELALSRLMEIGIDKNRRVWTVIDELPALGVLPALSPLMAEGRKYGACVIACMQSLNQLFDKYGGYAGSSIFGQFGTSFYFRNTEPAIAKMLSSMCGQEIIMRQQKNTSFGAHEFRDGVSYSEQQYRNPLIEIDDLANLTLGECYVLLPEPKVRVSKIQTPEIDVKNQHIGFIQKQETEYQFKDNNFLSPVCEIQSNDPSKITATDSGVTNPKVKSSSIKEKRKKNLRKQVQKAPAQTINNKESKKITDDFMNRF